MIRPSLTYPGSCVDSFRSAPRRTCLGGMDPCRKQQGPKDGWTLSCTARAEREDDTNHTFPAVTRRPEAFPLVGRGFALSCSPLPHGKPRKKCGSICYLRSPKGLKDDCIEKRELSQDPSHRPAAAACPRGVIEPVIIAHCVVSELLDEPVDYFFAVIGSCKELQDASERYRGGVRPGEQAEDHLFRRQVDNSGTQQAGRWLCMHTKVSPGHTAIVGVVAPRNCRSPPPTTLSACYFSVVAPGGSVLRQKKVDRLLLPVKPRG